MHAVVTNCTKEKLSEPAPARELYRGPSVARIVKIVDEVREMGMRVDLFVISAKYGLLHENQVIHPYDETLSGRAEVKKWAREMGLPQRFRKLMESRTVALVVTKPYYIAVEEAVCDGEVYVLSPYRPTCGVWIKTGNFNKHIKLREWLIQRIHD